MDRRILIVRDNNAINLILLLILVVIEFFLIFYLTISINNNQQNIEILLIFVFISFFIFLMYKILFHSHIIEVNDKDGILEIIGPVKKIFWKKIYFRDIKKVNIIEYKEFVIDYGYSWQIKLEIIGKNNNYLFVAKVRRIFNVDEFVRSCNIYFVINTCNDINE
jgi:hypothetical protein